MKAAALALGLLAFGGCGSIQSVGSGPRIYGGVRQDLAWMEMRCVGCLRSIGYLDLPFSAVVDTALLPVTVVAEAVR